MTAPARARPSWVALAALPAVNLTVALALSAVVVLLVGENPLRALRVRASGAFGDAESIGYTLYYATNFVFTGLAVAVAFHASLFNIGAEGQAYIGGLGVALLCLGAGAWPQLLVIPAAVVVAAAAGAAWAFLPGWLQARRGSHVVITTIMFNFIASALMTYLLVNVLIKPGQQSPETREFAPNTWLPQLQDAAEWLGGRLGHSPLNLSSLLALLAGVLVWFYLWHTRWGYELRALGHNETAAVYGGIPPARTVIVVSPGFDVAGEAESGEDAVAQAESLRPDLVLMDINLPGINGIEATRQITTANPGTVVILMSTYRAEDLPADAMDSGAAAYVHKEDFGPAIVRQIWDEHHTTS